MDSRQIQDLTHQVQKVLTATGHVVQGLTLLVGQGAVEAVAEELCVAQYAVQRGAELVAHVADELRLQTLAFLQLPCFALEFQNHLLQFLSVLLLAAQGFHPLGDVANHNLVTDHTVFAEERPRADFHRHHFAVRPIDFRLDLVQTYVAPPLATNLIQHLAAALLRQHICVLKADQLGGLATQQRLGGAVHPHDPAVRTKQADGVAGAVEQLHVLLLPVLELGFQVLRLQHPPDGVR